MMILENVTSQISAVTIYRAGAVVTRTAQFKLMPGENTVLLTGLSTTLKKESITVAAEPEVTITGVEYRTTTLLDRQQPQQQAVIQKRLEELEIQISKTEDEIVAYEQQREIVNQNCDISQNKELALNTVKELNVYCLQKNNEILQRLSELHRIMKKQLEEQEQLKAEAAALADSSTHEVGLMTLTLLCEKELPTQVEFSYYEKRAGWAPQYDLRVTDTQNPAQLQLKAKLRQATGEDWPAVPIVLSSGRANFSNSKPELEPWYLRLQNEAVCYAELSASKDMSCASSLMIKSKSEMMMDEAPEAEIYDGQASVEFALPGTHALSSRQQGDTTLTVMTHSLNATYTYYSVPKYDKAVYLLACITGWESLHLLPGEAAVYLRGRYAGTALVDPANAEEELKVSLGCDEGVIVTRTLGRDTDSKALLSVNKKQVRRLELSVRNTKAMAVDLQLLEQVPVSTDSAIEVKVEELSGADMDAETGEVCWKLHLQPGESAKKQVRYSVTSPKNAKLTLE